jgi:hypothetical protein
MSAQERLRQAIDQQESRLRADIPLDRQGAILALVRAQDRLPSSHAIEPRPDLVTGRRFTDLGGNKALQLCLESTGGDSPTPSPSSSNGLDGWAERFLQECGRLAEAELVLAHSESGFMRLVDDGSGTFDAWIATKRTPASWRERADFDWWAAWLAARQEPELHALRSELTNNEPRVDALYRRLANVRLDMMAYQLGYPPGVAICGCTVQTYRDVLGQLIALALQARDHGDVPAPQSQEGLVTALASALGADPTVIGQAIASFTLDRTNAAYHAAVPGVAPAPLVRIDQNQLVWSLHGLTTQPLLFLTRELRRRDAPQYHNVAHLREPVFRQDLYALFPDKRFVTSAGRIALRRADGDVRTDVDAAVFDRKSGALGLFELKSQDPFARSTAELARQRDNVLYANRQISGVLDWLYRHGPDALLARFDSRTAKTFRVQKVYPFVLGRYLAHFSDGPEPDRRAAWGTWPQLLRLRDGQQFQASDGSPLATIFTRLMNDVPLVRPPVDLPSREIVIGAARLIVHPSYAAFQASAADGRGSRQRGRDSF